ncbi:transposase [Bacteroides vulgatus]|uniref:IS66 family transposase n=1 Tax=Phocaeicola vulgatus TaxID=821 RepID=UPI00155E8C2D|nr:transposase [Phocaeicola vulgatus]NMX16528.1 transposase [Phocaeicola vulgatus]
MIDLQDIITTKRELLSRETYSRNPINYSAGMAEDQKDRYIQYLAEQNQDLRLTGDAMRLVLEDFMAQMKELKDQMSSMQSKHVDLENRLSEEHKLRKSAERKIKSLQEKLDYANQERFGDRRQKIQSKAKTSDSDRRKEKDDYDGTDDTLRTDSVGHVPSQELKEPSGKDRDLSNRPDGYKTMGVAGEATEHPSDLTKVPGRIIERRMVRVFSFRTFLTEECFEMVHYAEPGKKPKWGYFPSEGHPDVVTSFEGTRATPEFLQAIAYEVYVKNVTFGLLHQWLTDMGMTISKNTLRNWLKKGKTYLDELDHYKKCYIWVLVNKARKTAIFFYENGSRGRDVLTDFLGDAELKSIMSDGYNAYVFIGNELKSARFKDTVHQVCMSHAKNKFVKASNQGGEPTAERFSEILKEFFMRERKYDDAGLTPKERFQERQSLETKELLIELRSLLDSEQSKDSEFRSRYYKEALNYLNRFWKEIFAYLDDGELPIDNNLAERTIRKLTTQRNNSLHYGSDAGAEMAATYHSVIGTVKLHGSSIWNFIGTFFKNIFNGCRDYVNMVPDKITLAASQC